MIKTSTALLVVTALANILCALPAQAQRVFVSGAGSDSNPCTFTQPCRSFQQAFNTVVAVTTSGGEIDVLDPAGYGALNITHAISVQGHGFAGITQATSGANAITINAGGTDEITLNGLLLDGEGTGQDGVLVNTAGSVQILNCVIRHFTDYGVIFAPTNSPSNLLVSDTVTSDNGATGIFVEETNGVATTPATLNRVTANNNNYGVTLNGGYLMIANSVMSNNSSVGLQSDSGTAWLGTSAISGNTGGVNVSGGTINSYGNNAINGNMSDISGMTTISPE